MQKPTQTLKSVKNLGNTFDLNPKWARTLQSEIFHGIFKETPNNSFNRSWYSTPCCGLEVRKPTQAVRSVKGRGYYTFDLNPKWAGTLSSEIFHGIFKEIPLNNCVLIVVDILHHVVGFRCRKPHRHLSQLITWELCLPPLWICPVRPSVRHTVCQRNSSETTEQNVMKLGR